MLQYLAQSALIKVEGLFNAVCTSRCVSFIWLITKIIGHLFETSLNACSYSIVNQTSVPALKYGKILVFIIYF